MSTLELWTKVAIWLLIGGSIVVFLWFAHDLARLSRTFGHGPVGPQGDGEPSGAVRRDDLDERRAGRLRAEPPPEEP